MFENLNKNILLKNEIKEDNHNEIEYNENISNISLDNKGNENYKNDIEGLSININIIKIKRNDDLFDKFQNKNNTEIKEISPNHQNLMENQSNFSNHFSKNFVVLKEKEINSYDPIQIKKLILNTQNQNQKDNHTPQEEKKAEKENIKYIKFNLKINYENDLIDLTNINKLLGKTELENLSNDISNEAEKYKCTEFKLLSKFLTYKSLRSFSKFFLNCNNLKFLDLNESSIGDIGCKYLSQAFLKSKNISEINLQKNMISDIGAEILANCIKVNKNFTKIELEHNLIGNFGGKKLIESLKENKKIKWVNLFGNNSLDNNIISLISELLRSNRISNRPKKIKQNI
jgi:hypothetical protein